MRILVSFDGQGGSTVASCDAEKSSSGAAGLELLFDVDLAGVGIGGDLWPAATMFSNLLSAPCYRQFFAAMFSTSSAGVELGSGTGMCGCLIDKLYQPKQIFITDQESHMELIRQNMMLNSSGKTVEARALDWTAKDYSSIFTAGSADVILAMECVYNASLYKALIRAILHLTHANSIIFLGITRQFASPSFFALLTESGLSYTLLPHEALPPISCVNTGGAECGLFLLKKLPQFN